MFVFCSQKPFLRSGDSGSQGESDEEEEEDVGDGGGEPSSVDS